MNSKDRNEMLVNQIRTLAELLKDGMYDKIDVSAIESEDPALAANFRAIVNNLKIEGEKMIVDRCDLQLINEHLSHISETTEKGVLVVLNTAEAMMDDANNVSDKLEDIRRKFPNNDELENLAADASHHLEEIKNKCFTIITSLEFEDINRQLLQRITFRLDKLYEDIAEIAAMFNFYEHLDRKDSAFLESLKHIADIQHSRQTQDMVDVLFEEF